MGGYASPTAGGGSYGGPPQAFSFFNNNAPTQGGGFNNNIAPAAMPYSGGSNQYFGAMPGMSSPGTTASPQPTSSGSGNNPYLNQPSENTPYNNTGYGPSGGPLAPSGNEGPGASHNLGHGVIATGLQFPGLGEGFSNYLMSQIGQGMNPFNQTTVLPTGGSTMAGQMTAGMNPLLAQLAQFFQTGQGGGMPGMSTLSNIANNGVSALPEWQAMIAAQNQNNQQNQANLAGQFASMGDLAGSGFGTAMSNYQSQTAASQNALLGQLQQSNIQNIQMPAINELFSGSQAMAGGLQNLDQSAINAQLQQFQTDAPQNNPMLQYIGQYGSLFPPTTKTATFGEQFDNTLSAAGSLIGGITGSGGASSMGLSF